MRIPIAGACTFLRTIVPPPHIHLPPQFLIVLHPWSSHIYWSAFEDIENSDPGQKRHSRVRVLYVLALSFALTQIFIDPCF